MEFPKLKEKVAELNAKRADLKAFFDEARDPDSGDLDASRLKNYKLPDGVAMREHVLAADKEFNVLKDEVEELKVEKRAAEFAYDDPEAAESGTEPGARARSVPTIGRAFVESEAFKEYGGGSGPAVTLDIDPRNTLFTTTAGFPPESTRTGDIDLSPQPRHEVLNFVPQIPHSQAAVKFMRETTFTDAAIVEKAEGTAYGEAAFALTEQNIPIQKIPAFLPLTDESLEDEESAEAYVTSRLVYVVRKRLNTQILQGSGVVPFLEGTENVTGIQTQALGVDPIPDAIYKLMVKIMDDATNSGGDADPDVVFIRATKWQTVRLLRTSDGIYIWGNPSEAGPNRIWGIPVGLTNAVTATKAVIGDYRTHSYLAVKRGVDVKVSDSHGTFFAEGKLAMRADIRVAMVHLRPSAFGEVTGL